MPSGTGSPGLAPLAYGPWTMQVALFPAAFVTMFPLLSVGEPYWVGGAAQPFADWFSLIVPPGPLYALKKSNCCGLVNTSRVLDGLPIKYVCESPESAASGESEAISSTMRLIRRSV